MIMYKILGNLCLLISAPIFALTTASVNQTWFYPGDQVVLTLSSDGNKVSFPSIGNIDGNNILYTSNSQKISIVNNKQSRHSSQSYVIQPSKSFSIPAYTLIVDGGKQTTQPIEINLKNPEQAKPGDDYILQIEADKPTFFLGDEINLKVIFKVKKSISSSNQVGITMPEVKDLLFIKNNKSIQSTDENYNIHTLNYRLRADNFGTFNIPSVVASIGNQNTNTFGNFPARGKTSQIKKIHSNTLTITVNPLPDALRIFGDFKIKASIDKTQVKQGDAVNLTLIISGNGNLGDIEKFKLDIDSATVYSDDATFTYNQWQQKFAIVGGKSFAIPSLKFDYFDKITQSKKSIATKPIDIQIEVKEPIQNLLNKTGKLLPGTDSNLPTSNLKYYYLLLGIIIGIIVSALVIALKNIKSKTDKSLINQIKLARGDKALFDLLLPLNIAGLSAMLEQLEANIYKNAQHKIRKKDIINAIKFEHKIN
ncbi:MAG: hypothetical protein DSZ14_08120 [Candidatus Thioglobus sp.]|nr:MAG: hypothetical protein DSZ14_08120 [Candidatus Thioglobus sp.]